MTVPGNLSSPLLATAAAAGGAALTGPAIKSVRFNEPDGAKLARTPSSSSNRKTFTYSAWIKRAADSGTNFLFVAGSTDAHAIYMNGIGGSATLVVSRYVGSFTYYIETTAAFRDPAAWYHIVVAYDTTQSTASNRVKIYVNGVQVTDFSSASYPAQNSEYEVNSTVEHRIGKSCDMYFADVHFIDGSALAPTSFGAFDTDNVWQVAEYSGTFGTNGFHLLDFANESGIGNDSSGNDNDFTVNNISQASLTTWSNGWSNNLLSGFPATNSFNGTGTGLTIGGSSVKSTWTAPSSIPFTTLSIRGAHDGANIKVNGTDVTSQFSSGLSVVTVTGISSPLTSIDLDNTNGQGNARISAIRIDGELLADATPYPGAGNDVLFDVPVNGDASNDTGAGGQLSSNYPTMNPLAKNSNTTLTNGNLDVSSTAVYTTLSTIAFPSTGKFYAEFKINGTSSGYPFVGIGGFNDTAIFSNANPNTGAFYAQGGYVTGSVSVSSLTALSAGDIVGVAYDTSNGKVWFSINGTYVSSGDPANGNNPTTTLSANASGYCLATSTYQSGTVTLNAGQRAFNTNAPSGFKCLCTSNLPTPAVADGLDGFETKLWTGNASSRTISGFSMRPDLVWMKNRSFGTNYELYDRQRGVEQVLKSDIMDAEATESNGLTTFGSTSFNIGNNNPINRNNDSIVGWVWNAGSGIYGQSNSSGSITSNVRANQTTGFSIVTYTGTGSNATVGHGLGAAPDFIIIKDRDASTDWMVYHESLGNTKYLNLNLTAAAVTAVHWQNTSPTSTVFSIGTSIYLNNSGNDYVAYCFTAIEGYSNYGEYDGTGSDTSTPFQYCGFRPAWILIKSDSSSEDWVIYDTARGPENVVDNVLRPGRDNIEATADERKLDILSNGFKFRGNEGSINAASKSYVWWAIAENPFQANGGLAR